MNLLEASVYVHLDRYIALNLGEQVALPAVDRHPGPGGRALPRRADRGRHAGRGAHPGRPGHAGRRAAGPDPLPGAPRARVAGVPGHRRHRDRRRRDGRRPCPRARTEGGALRRFGGALQRLAGRAERRRTARRRESRESGADAACSATRAGTTGDRPSWRCGWRRTRRCRRGIRWPSRCGWMPCTSSTSAATASTSAGAE